MIFGKKNKNKLKKEAYREKFLKPNSNEETTKINMDNFDVTASEKDLAFERFSSLSSKDLQFKLEFDSLSPIEISIIKKILNDRQ